MQSKKSAMELNHFMFIDFIEIDIKVIDELDST